MRVIGITGGVGAGKSTLLEYLRKHFGAYVIQADQVGHAVMEPETACYEKILALFGKQIIKSDKTIDRGRVSDVVFSNGELLAKLNGIIHPAVKEEILRCMAAERERGRGLFIVEAALLLEDHYDDICDEVWYIYADKEIRIKRLMESRGYTRLKAESIISSQASDEFFRAHADYVVDNSGSLEESYHQIDRGVEKYETL